MRLGGAIVLMLGVALATSAAAQPAPGSYGKDWHRSSGWSGEYAAGFLMISDATLPMRATADPAAPQALSCKLNRRANYHPFNQKRVKSDKLEFVTFSRIIEYTVTKATDIVLVGPGKDLKVRMERGATWRWVRYLAEGAFEVEYRGKRYDIDPDSGGGTKLLENSRPAAGDGPRAEDNEHQWMQVTCANGVRGWLLLAEVKKSPAVEFLEGPGELVQFHEASDAPK